jgi:hypothetical protein
MNSLNTMPSSLAKVSGPASEAFEQQFSKKRRLSYAPVEEPPAFDAFSFAFDAMFETVSDDCEAFPSIGWDFDDEADSHANSFDGEAVLQALIEHKRVQGSGMLRSQSLKRNLASLDSLNTRVSLASIASMSIDKKPPLDQFSLGCKVDCVPIFGKTTASGSLRPALSRCKLDLVRSQSLRTIRTY